MSNKYEDLIKNARVNAECGEHMSPAEVTTLLNVFETTFAALAAENAGLKQFPDQIVSFIGKLGSSEIGRDTKEKIEFAANKVKTPATDAFLAEIERKAIRKFINSIEHILRDKLSPYDTEEMLEAMRIFLEEQGGEQK